MISQLILWSIVGWCGTPPGRIPIPVDPDPTPWWLRATLGVAGGIAGGFLVNNGLGMEAIAASSFGAFAGGRILYDVASPLVRTQTQRG